MAFELKGKMAHSVRGGCGRLPGLDNGSHLPWSEAKVNKNVKKSVAKAIFLRREDCLEDCLEYCREEWEVGRSGDSM